MDYGPSTIDSRLAPVCDLVLLSWNHLEQTQPCLETLFATTTVPCRLFIVDNGSEPSVRAFLQSVAPRGAIQDVQLIQRQTNEGFPRGMNHGIRASTAPYVCLLNNDLRFTPGWLEGLLAVTEAHPEVGVVNPESNTFGNVPPSGMSLEAYAAQLAPQRGRYTEVGMCIGFCMLITRAVIDRIGGLSEEVERIFFEDEDYCMRAQAAGYRCVVADGCYVHHAEHQTVKKMPEREALFARNRNWCNEKWGRRLRIAWPRFTPVVPGSAELRQWLERLVAWARRRTYVYVYCPMPDGVDWAGLFRSVGIAPHADVRWHRLPRVGARALAAGHILKRRKKRFDLIAAPEARWGRWLDGLRWLHGADVVPATDEHTLVEQWKRQSQSPSSS